MYGQLQKIALLERANRRALSGQSCGRRGTLRPLMSQQTNARATSWCNSGSDAAVSLIGSGNLRSIARAGVCNQFVYRARRARLDALGKLGSSSLGNTPADRERVGAVLTSVASCLRRIAPIRRDVAPACLRLRPGRSTVPGFAQSACAQWSRRQKKPSAGVPVCPVRWSSVQPRSAVGRDPLSCRPKRLGAVVGTTLLAFVSSLGAG